MVKKLTGSFLTNNRVHYTLSVWEEQALYAKAAQLHVSKLALIKGVLSGDYSVKDVLTNAKRGPINIRCHINVTTKDRHLINEIAYEKCLTIDEVIRGILYETI